MEVSASPARLRYASGVLSAKQARWSSRGKARVNEQFTWEGGGPSVPPSPEQSCTVSLSAAVAADRCTAAHRSHLVRNPDIEWSDVPDLPKAAQQLLSEKFTRCTSTVAQTQRSSDGETVKLLVTLQDGYQVESVIMTYDTTGVPRAMHCPLQKPITKVLLAHAEHGTKSCYMGMCTWLTVNAHDRACLGPPSGNAVCQLAGRLQHGLHVLLNRQVAKSSGLWNSPGIGSWQRVVEGLQHCAQ
eukprot:365535-Chlamydomonas_euryale.AAC.52